VILCQQRLEQIARRSFLLTIRPFCRAREMRIFKASA
jgi:hypothetical protein